MSERQAEAPRKEEQGAGSRKIGAAEMIGLSVRGAAKSVRDSKRALWVAWAALVLAGAGLVVSLFR